MTKKTSDELQKLCDDAGYKDIRFLLDPGVAIGHIDQCVRETLNCLREYHSGHMVEQHGRFDA